MSSAQLKKKIEIAAAMLTFLLNYTNESIRSECICGSASQNSEMELFHAWAGRFRENSLNCRVHTDSKMLTRYGQKKAITFFILLISFLKHIPVPSWILAVLFCSTSLKWFS